MSRSLRKRETWETQAVGEHGQNAFYLDIFVCFCGDTVIQLS